MEIGGNGKYVIGREVQREQQQLTVTPCASQDRVREQEELPMDCGWRGSRFPWKSLDKGW